MTQNLKPKICILVDALSTGGAEKAASILSILLSNDGYLVSIISLRDNITYSYKGTLFNLGENEPSLKALKQIQKTIKLRKAIRHINPHFIIDYRMRNRFLMEFILYQYIFRSYTNKIIYRINSFNIDWHIPKGSYFKNKYKKEKLVAVSLDIKKELENKYNFNNVTYIPNTFSVTNNNQQSNNTIACENYILAIGSLRNKTKQFDKLIATYAQSILKNKGYKLYILGDGYDKTTLQTQINNLKLQQDVVLLGYKKQIFNYIKQARYVVLCSKVEGFPNVLLEALSLNTPVVSFNCKSGPSEMVVDKQNGLLVKDQDFKALKTAMETLILDEALYMHCKSNTDLTLHKFRANTILNTWKQLFV